MTLSLIYARSENYCIGKEGQIPWHLPDEFAHFKRTTRGRPIIMGRRTYEDHESALPDRLNIVVTSAPDYPVAASVLVVPSFEAALSLAKEHHEDVFVVGGAGLFALAFPLSDRVYETIVDTVVSDGDTFVPAFDFSGFRPTVLETHPSDARHPQSFTVTRYDRVPA